MGSFSSSPSLEQSLLPVHYCQTQADLCLFYYITSMNLSDVAFDINQHMPSLLHYLFHGANSNVHLIAPKAFRELLIYRHAAILRLLYRYNMHIPSTNQLFYQFLKSNSVRRPSHIKGRKEHQFLPIAQHSPYYDVIAQVLTYGFPSPYQSPTLEQQKELSDALLQLPLDIRHILDHYLEDSHTLQRVDVHHQQPFRYSSFLSYFFRHLQCMSEGESQINATVAHSISTSTQQLNITYIHTQIFINGRTLPSLGQLGHHQTMSAHNLDSRNSRIYCGEFALTSILTPLYVLFRKNFPIDSYLNLYGLIPMANIDEDNAPMAVYSTAPGAARQSTENESHTIRMRLLDQFMNLLAPITRPPTLGTGERSASPHDQKGSNDTAAGNQDRLKADDNHRNHHFLTFSAHQALVKHSIASSLPNHPQILRTFRDLCRAHRELRKHIHAIDMSLMPNGLIWALIDHHYCLDDVYYTYSKHIDTFNDDITYTLTRFRPRVHVIHPTKNMTPMMHMIRSQFHPKYLWYCYKILQKTTTREEMRTILNHRDHYGCNLLMYIFKYHYYTHDELECYRDYDLTPFFSPIPSTSFAAPIPNESATPQSAQFDCYDDWYPIKSSGTPPISMINSQKPRHHERSARRQLLDFALLLLLNGDISVDLLDNRERSVLYYMYQSFSPGAAAATVFMKAILLRARSVTKVLSSGVDIVEAEVYRHDDCIYITRIAYLLSRFRRIPCLFPSTPSFTPPQPLSFFSLLFAQAFARDHPRLNLEDYPYLHSCCVRRPGIGTVFPILLPCKDPSFFHVIRYIFTAHPWTLNMGGDFMVNTGQMLIDPGADPSEWMNPRAFPSPAKHAQRPMMYVYQPLIYVDQTNEHQNKTENKNPSSNSFAQQPGMNLSNACCRRNAPINANTAATKPLHWSGKTRHVNAYLGRLGFRSLLNYIDYTSTDYTLTRKSLAHPALDHFYEYHFNTTPVSQTELEAAKADPPQGAPEQQTQIYTREPSGNTNSNPNTSAFQQHVLPYNITQPLNDALSPTVPISNEHMDAVLSILNWLTQENGIGKIFPSNRACVRQRAVSCDFLKSQPTSSFWYGPSVAEDRFQGFIDDSQHAMPHHAYKKAITDRSKDSVASSTGEAPPPLRPHLAAQMLIGEGTTATAKPQPIMMMANITQSGYLEPPTQDTKPITHWFNKYQIHVSPSMFQTQFQSKLELNPFFTGPTDGSPCVPIACSDVTTHTNPDPLLTPQNHFFPKYDQLIREISRGEDVEIPSINELDNTFYTLYHMIPPGSSFRPTSAQGNHYLVHNTMSDVAITLLSWVLLPIPVHPELFTKILNTLAPMITSVVKIALLLASINGHPVFYVESLMKRFNVHPSLIRSAFTLLFSPDYCTTFVNSPMFTRTGGVVHCLHNHPAVGWRRDLIPPMPRQLVLFRYEQRDKVLSSPVYNEHMKWQPLADRSMMLDGYSDTSRPLYVSTPPLSALGTILSDDESPSSPFYASPFEHPITQAIIDCWMRGGMLHLVHLAQSFATSQPIISFYAKYRIVLQTCDDVDRFLPSFIGNLSFPVKRPENYQQPSYNRFRAMVLDSYSPRPDHMQTTFASTSSNRLQASPPPPVDQNTISPEHDSYSTLHAAQYLHVARFYAQFSLPHNTTCSGVGEAILLYGSSFKAILYVYLSYLTSTGTSLQHCLHQISEKTDHMIIELTTAPGWMAGQPVYEELIPQVSSYIQDMKSKKQEMNSTRHENTTSSGSGNASSPAGKGRPHIDDLDKWKGMINYYTANTSVLQFLDLVLLNENDYCYPVLMAYTHIVHQATHTRMADSATNGANAVTSPLSQDVWKEIFYVYYYYFNLLRIDPSALTESLQGEMAASKLRSTTLASEPPSKKDMMAFFQEDKHSRARLLAKAKVAPYPPFSTPTGQQGQQPRVPNQVPDPNPDTDCPPVPSVDNPYENAHRVAYYLHTILQNTMPAHQPLHTDYILTSGVNPLLWPILDMIIKSDTFYFFITRILPAITSLEDMAALISPPPASYDDEDTTSSHSSYQDYNHDDTIDDADHISHSQFLDELLDHDTIDLDGIPSEGLNPSHGSPDTRMYSHHDDHYHHRGTIIMKLNHMVPTGLGFLMVNHTQLTMDNYTALSMALPSHIASRYATYVYNEFGEPFILHAIIRHVDKHVMLALLNTLGDINVILPSHTIVIEDPLTDHCPKPRCSCRVFHSNDGMADHDMNRIHVAFTRSSTPQQADNVPSRPFISLGRQTYSVLMVMIASHYLFVHQDMVSFLFSMLDGGNTINWEFADHNHSSYLHYCYQYGAPLHFIMYLLQHYQIHCRSNLKNNNHSRLIQHPFFAPDGDNCTVAYYSYLSLFGLQQIHPYLASGHITPTPRDFLPIRLLIAYASTMMTWKTLAHLLHPISDGVARTALARMADEVYRYLNAHNYYYSDCDEDDDDDDDEDENENNDKDKDDHHTKELIGLIKQEANQKDPKWQSKSKRKRRLSRLMVNYMPDGRLEEHDPSMPSNALLSTTGISSLQFHGTGHSEPFHIHPKWYYPMIHSGRIIPPSPIDDFDPPPPRNRRNKDSRSPHGIADFKPLPDLIDLRADLDDIPLCRSEVKRIILAHPVLKRRLYLTRRRSEQRKQGKTHSLYMERRAVRLHSYQAAMSWMQSMRPSVDQRCEDKSDTQTQDKDDGASQETDEDESQMDEDEDPASFPLVGRKWTKRDTMKLTEGAFTSFLYEIFTKLYLMTMKEKATITSHHEVQSPRELIIHPTLIGGSAENHRVDIPLTVSHPLHPEAILRYWLYYRVIFLTLYIGMDITQLSLQFRDIPACKLISQHYEARERQIFAIPEAERPTHVALIRAEKSHYSLCLFLKNTIVWRIEWENMQRQMNERRLYRHGAKPWVIGAPPSALPPSPTSPPFTLIDPIISLLFISNWDVNREYRLMPLENVAVQYQTAHNTLLTYLLLLAKIHGDPEVIPYLKLLFAYGADTNLYVYSLHVGHNIPVILMAMFMGTSPTLIALLVQHGASLSIHPDYIQEYDTYYPREATDPDYGKKERSILSIYRYIITYGPNPSLITSKPLPRSPPPAPILQAPDIQHLHLYERLLK